MVMRFRSSCVQQFSPRTIDRKNELNCFIIPTDFSSFGLEALNMTGTGITIVFLRPTFNIFLLRLATAKSGRYMFENVSAAHIRVGRLSATTLHHPISEPPPS